MSRTDADLEAFINDLDTDETELAVELIAGLDPLAQEDGKPKYTGEEITLIGRFQQFAVDYPTDEEDDDFEDEDVEDDEESEDIAGTGETKEEYEARVQAEQNQATADAAAAEVEAADSPSQIDQNPSYDKGDEVPAPKAWEPSLSDQAMAEERNREPGWGTVI